MKSDARPKKEPRAADDRRAPLDVPHLRSLTLSDPQLEREVLGLFSDQAAGALRGILNADGPGPRREAAHRLAGAAKAIGAWDLAAVASEIEAQQALSARSAEALSRTMTAVVDYVTLRLAG
jgi:HPt (histidine-containing phosphotransfer) domain-containing protein